MAGTTLPVFRTFLQHPCKLLYINIYFIILGVAMLKTGEIRGVQTKNPSRTGENEYGSLQRTKEIQGSLNLWLA